MAIRNLMIAFCLIFSVGCFNLTEVPGDKLTPVVVAPKHATPEAIFTILGNAVHEGVIDTKFELAQYVKSLRDFGDLSQADEAKFDAEFPEAPEDHSALDPKTDAAKLWSMK